jgi:HK97 family phage prohead protease
MRNRERRWVTTDVGYTTRDGDSNPIITGHPIVFNKWTTVGDYFREIVRPGVSKKTIKESDIRALQNHDPNYVLARRAGKKTDTLRLKEDDVGLGSEIDVAPTTFGKNLIISMDRGDVTQMSFGFLVKKERWTHKEGKMSERELLEIELFDVSVVTFPQYPEASAQVRAALQTNDFEKLTEVFFRIDHSMDLTDNDRQVLKRHLDICRSYVPQKTEPVTSHSRDDKSVANHLDSDVEAEKERLRAYVARKREIELLELIG